MRAIRMFRILKFKKIAQHIFGMRCVPRMSQSFHTYECLLSENKSRFSTPGSRYVWHINKTTDEWVMCHVWASQATHKNVYWMKMQFVPHKGAGIWDTLIRHATDKWVIFHMNESIHIWISHVSHEACATGHGASGGALAPAPPCATCFQPRSIRTFCSDKNKPGKLTQEKPGELTQVCVCACVCVRMCACICTCE